MRMKPLAVVDTHIVSDVILQLKALKSVEFENCNSLLLITVVSKEVSTGNYSYCYENDFSADTAAVTKQSPAFLSIS